MADLPVESEHLLLKIKHALPSYPRAYRQLADYILHSTYAASSMNIEALAQAANVSIATVNRFVRDSGYSGFPQFKAALHQVFDPILAPIQKAHQQQQSQQSPTQVCLDNAISNLHIVGNNLADDRLQRAVEMMLSARHIAVAGMGVSAFHAAFLVDAIEPFLSNNSIKTITSFAGTERTFRQAGMLTSKDLLIAITLPRYSRDIVELAMLARQCECKILSLTDELTSPLIPLSDATLLAVSQHPYLYASSVPMVALIEILTLALMQRIDDLAGNVARQTETVLPYLYRSK